MHTSTDWSSIDQGNNHSQSSVLEREKRNVSGVVLGRVMRPRLDDTVVYLPGVHREPPEVCTTLPSQEQVSGPRQNPLSPQPPGQIAET